VKYPLLRSVYDRPKPRLADDPPSLWQAVGFGGIIAAIVIGFSLLMLGG